jgi:tRNA 2-thiocytidine biosynthesis protein TtcA
LKQIRKVLASLKRADNTFNLIEDGDKIAVGISGGKDSIVLFYALNLYKKFAKKDFTLVPIMLNLGFDNFDATSYVDYFKSIDYELEIVDSTQVYEILKRQQELKKMTHLPCSICSRMKKAAINTEAKKVGANKVAFAHHIDDAIETLFMNMISGSRIATFSPKMHLENVDITFIRPFILLDEQTISKTQKELDLPLLESGCPNDKHTRREDVKVLLNKIYLEFPEAKENFQSMLLNFKSFDLWFDKFNMPLDKNLYYTRVINPKQTQDFLNLTYANYGFPLKENAAKPLLNMQNCFVLYKNDLPVASLCVTDLKANTILISLISITENVNEKEFLLFLETLEKVYFRAFKPLIIYIDEDNKHQDLLLKANYLKQTNELLPYALIKKIGN